MSTYSLMNFLRRDAVVMGFSCIHSGAVKAVSRMYQPNGEVCTLATAVGIRRDVGFERISCLHDF